MLEGVAEIPPGSEGLITLPYFAGERTPINDPDARGVLFGLTLQHTRAHLYRSALEAVGSAILSISRSASWSRTPRRVSTGSSP